MFSHVVMEKVAYAKLGIVFSASARQREAAETSLKFIFFLVGDGDFDKVERELLVL